MAEPLITAEDVLGPTRPAKRQADQLTSQRANRRWWHADADDYHALHGGFLGDADFVWCPERLREADVGLLGQLAGRRVLEVGCGSAPCSRWLAHQGAQVVAFDLSGGMLRHAVTAATRTGIGVPLVQADAVSFVADSTGLMREVARVLRPRGRWVFSVTHPLRWIFPDDPGEHGLTAVQSYFDRSPYVEVDSDGVPAYVEHHRTLGDRIRDLRGAGFALEDLIEPQWPEDLESIWGQWSPLRGAIFPGTAIFVCANSESAGHSTRTPENGHVAEK